MPRIHRFWMAATLLAGATLAHAQFQPPEAPIASQLLARTSQSWDGSALPDYPRGRPEVSVLRIRIAPGAQLPMHKHPVINAGYLLRGELTVVTDDNRVLRLKAGEAIVELVDKWHSGRNEGTEPAEIVVVYVGVQQQPITVTKEP
jgi:quercetin dioxygenase-like cupin family protein